MKKLLALSLFGLFTVSAALAQTSPSIKANWTSNPFDHQVFIENKGQFGPELLGAGGKINSGEKILYAAQLGDVYAYITNRGIVYRYVAHPGVEPGRRIDADKLGDVKLTPHYLSAKWENSSEAGSDAMHGITTDKAQTYYYTYPKGDKQTIKANVFKKVTCSNVYPGIDVEYTFPKDKSGIKYSLILHPGAQISLAKLKYTGAENMQMDAKNNIVITCAWGKFIDHAPVSFYDNNKKNAIVSKYKLSGYEESFDAFYTDHSRTLVIDPWSTNWTENPAFSGGYNSAYDVDFDYAGNVYVYGGWAPFQLVKYNSAGIQQWVYNTSNFSYQYAYGDFCVDKASGTSYALAGFGGAGGAETDKISAAGVLLGTYNGNIAMNEQWRATFDMCDHVIIIAGGGSNSSTDDQAAVLDTSLSSYNMVNIMNIPASHPFHDMSLLALDPLLPQGYMASTSSTDVSTAGLDNNDLYKFPLPSLAPTTYSVADNYTFQEVKSITYVGPGTYGAAQTTNAMSGMAVSPNWLYMYDGATLKRRVKGTGALSSSTAITGTSYQWGGLDVDLCDNLYVGDQSNIDTYNGATLGKTGSIPVSGTVYDVVLGEGSTTLYACGNGFVTSISVTPPNPPYIAKAVTGPANCSCTGKAKATLMLCGNAVSNGLTYMWSDGETTQTATSLCPGIANVKITMGCGVIFQDTVLIQSKISIRDSVIAMTNIKCNGMGTGSLTIGVKGGASPYTYSWSGGGGSNASATGLTAGTYTLNITDANGCNAVGSGVITQPSAITGAMSVTGASCTSNNGTATITASGGASSYSYSWSPGNQTNATATGLSAGNYTVTITDANGCISTVSTTIIQSASFTETISTTPTACGSGGSGTATVSISGGATPYTYSWSPGNQTNSTITGLSAGNYTVTITDASGCTATVLASISQPSTIAAGIASFANEPCNGATTGNAAASASGGSSPYTYSWSSGGQTNTSATGLSAGTYTITVTDASNCQATASVAITQPTALSSSLSNDSICNGKSINLNANITGGTSPYTYSWSPGAGLNCTACPIPVASPTVTQCYSLTLEDNNGCTLTTNACVNVTTVSASLTVQSNDSICNNAGTITLFGSPNGGAYSGVAVYGDHFYPDSAVLKIFNVFYYTITNNGCKAIGADSLYVKNCTGVGINGVKAGSGELIVFPNPGNGEFTIVYNGLPSGHSEFIVTDVIGRELNAYTLGGETGKISINETSLSAGIYFYRLTNGRSDISCGKFIIVK